MYIDGPQGAREEYSLRLPVPKGGDPPPSGGRGRVLVLWSNFATNFVNVKRKLAIEIIASN
jgi:hypothetical protein